MIHNICIICNKTFWHNTIRKVCLKEACIRANKNLQAKQRRLRNKIRQESKGVDKLLDSVFPEIDLP